MGLEMLTTWPQVIARLPGLNDMLMIKCVNRVLSPIRIAKKDIAV